MTSQANTYGTLSLVPIIATSGGHLTGALSVLKSKYPADNLTTRTSGKGGSIVCSQYSPHPGHLRTMSRSCPLTIPSAKVLPHEPQTRSVSLYPTKKGALPARILLVGFLSSVRTASFIVAISTLFVFMPLGFILYCSGSKFCRLSYARLLFPLGFGQA